MAAAQAGWGKTALRNAASLVNAPRRTARADATPALALLLRCDGPKEVLSGQHPETKVLEEAKAEVRLALEAARRIPPKVRGDVALVRIDAGEQIHPLVAQAWRGRLADKVVIVANTGYRPGWVHIAARTATGQDLVAFMAAHRPPGLAPDDPDYGHGHPGASGGALRVADWNDFASALGYPEDRL
jgi:single-stranded-DNA-specific exonuclease